MATDRKVIFARNRLVLRLGYVVAFAALLFHPASQTVHEEIRRFGIGVLAIVGWTVFVMLLDLIEVGIAIWRETQERRKDNEH